MVALADVLEAAKIEELARDYRAAGYEVREQYPVGERRYDLVALKDSQRIAVEVQDRAGLRAASERIRQLREEAQRAGFSEFRLVIVNPPRERTIEVAGLEQALFDHLVDNVPEKLDLLSSHTILDGIDLTDLVSIDVTAEGIRVVGSGIVGVGLEYGGRSDGVAMTAEFPFTFDVVLTHGLTIADAHEITIDTDTFYE